MLSISKFKSKKSNESLYDVAYDLGVNYLEIIKCIDVPKKAVMFDIDDTLLLNSDKLIPIQPIINLLNFAKKNGFIILIITARDSKYTKQTKEELKLFGISYDYLYLRKSPQDDHIHFKSNIKKAYLEEIGITTIMSIGDNNVDIIGPYSGYAIKLPDKSDPRLFHINTNGKLENVVP